MATLAEIAAIKRRMAIGGMGLGSGVNADTGQTGAPNPVDSFMPGTAPQFVAPNISTGLNAPPQALATDADVTAAYQALMRYQAGADEARGGLRRQLEDTKVRSAADRARALMQANQRLADRGILNSGAALGQQNDLSTAYDQYDSDLQNQYNTAYGQIDRNILDLGDNYANAQTGASARLTQEAAKAAADALAQQLAVDRQNQMMADLMAMLMPPTLTAGPAPTVINPAVVNPAFNPINKAAAKPKVPVSGTTGYLAQRPSGGPQ